MALLHLNEADSFGTRHTSILQPKYCTPRNETLVMVGILSQKRTGALAAAAWMMARTRAAEKDAQVSMKRTPSLLRAVTAAICRQSCRKYEACVLMLHVVGASWSCLLLSNLCFSCCFLANKLRYLTLSDATK